MKKLSVGTIAYSRDCTPKDYMKRIRKAGYDSIDLGMYDYYNVIMSDEWESWAEGVLAAAKEAGITVGQAHAQLNYYTSADLTYEPPPEIFHRNLKISAMLGCKEIVFHPVFIKDGVETAAQCEALMDYNVRWFRELIGPATALGVHISIENGFSEKPQKVRAAFTTADDLLGLLDKIGEPSFGICIDTGHANIMSQNIPAMLKACGTRLRTVHLNDNYGMVSPIYPDMHLFPGSGGIDFAGVFSALRDINFTGLINLEPGDFIIGLPKSVRDASMAGGAMVAKAYMGM